MDTPLISIVVPIYGVERYLVQCLDSILAQTLREIEIILVDDGSPDKCPQIVDEYAKKDPRIVPVHQPNGGYGKAVNCGIRLARGEYVGIVESDDWIEPTMYERLYAAAQKYGVDLVKCSFFQYNSTLPVEEQNSLWYDFCDEDKEIPEGVFSPCDCPQIIRIHASIWAALYKSEFIKNIPLLETKGASYQDFPFLAEVLSTVGKMAFLKESLYHYRVEPGQNSSTTRGWDKRIGMLNAHLLARKTLEERGVLLAFQEDFFKFSYETVYSLAAYVSEKCLSQVLSMAKQIFEPIEKDKNFKFKYFREKGKCRCLYFCRGEMPPDLAFKRFRRKIFPFRLRWKEHKTLKIKLPHLTTVFDENYH